MPGFNVSFFGRQNVPLGLVLRAWSSKCLTWKRSTTRPCCYTSYPWRYCIVISADRGKNRCCICENIIFTLYERTFLTVTTIRRRGLTSYFEVLLVIIIKIGMVLLSQVVPNIHVSILTRWALPLMHSWTPSCAYLATVWVWTSWASTKGIC